MKAVFFGWLILISLSDLLFAQIRFDLAKRVSLDDPIYPVLMQYEGAMIRESEKGPAELTFSDWVLDDAPSIKQLFPNLRFASFSRDEHTRPGGDKSLNLAFGLEETLAVDPTKKQIALILSCNGNFGSFTKLLAMENVTLRNEKDAKVIWDAYCELTHQQWKDLPIKQITGSIWHFGETTHDETIESTQSMDTVITRTGYEEVDVDPQTGRITSWEGGLENSNERKIPHT